MAKTRVPFKFKAQLGASCNDVIISRTKYQLKREIVERQPRALQAAGAGARSGDHRGPVMCIGYVNGRVLSVRET